MTYQSASPDFAGQDQTAPSAPSALGRRILAASGRMFASIGAGLMRVSESASRVSQIEVLNAKSDAQLAQMGLKREDITRYVFRDMFYI